MNSYSFNVSDEQALSNYDLGSDAESSPFENSFLEDLIHKKSHIAASKLEVLAAALIVRVDILKENLIAIDQDREKAEAMLAKISHEVLFCRREQRDKNVFYQSLFALEKERRSQASECWRDIVMVIRDFLGVWEAHQQAQARAIFLDDAGR